MTKKYVCPKCKIVLIFNGSRTTPCSDGINADAMIDRYSCSKCLIEFNLWDTTKFGQPERRFWFGLEKENEPTLIEED
jgi:hypothetical protein